MRKLSQRLPTKGARRCDRDTHWRLDQTILRWRCCSHAICRCKHEHEPAAQTILRAMTVFMFSWPLRRWLFRRARSVRTSNRGAALGKRSGLFPARRDARGAEDERGRKALEVSYASCSKKPSPTAHGSAVEVGTIAASLHKSDTLSVFCAPSWTASWRLRFGLCKVSDANTTIFAHRHMGTSEINARHRSLSFSSRRARSLAHRCALPS
jgi:hypothetical protein